MRHPYKLMGAIIVVIVALFFSDSAFSRKILEREITTIEGDLYFKLIDFGSLYGSSEEGKERYRSMIDSLKNLSVIADTERMLLELNDFLVENELIDKPYFYLRVESSRIMPVYINEQDFSKISKYKNWDLVDKGKKVRLILEGKLLEHDVFFADRIVAIAEIDGETHWRK